MDLYEVRDTLQKGRGVFALKSIKAGTEIGDYEGKLLPYYEIDPQDYPYLMYLITLVNQIAQ